MRTARTLVTAAIAAVALTAAAGADAAMIQVNSLTDTAAPSGCTLRRAIATANTNVASPGCATAGNGNDVITFAPGLSGGTISLDTSELLIGPGGGTLSIQGPGPTSLIVDGPPADRVFEVSAATTATISGLTIQGGNGGSPISNKGQVSGAGVLNAGTLTLDHASVNNNYALRTATATSMPASAISDGGGVFNVGQLTITDSTVAGNTAEASATSNNVASAVSEGAGVSSSGGTLTVARSTIANNQATASASGGVSNATSTDGNGVYVTGGTGHSVVQSTIATNTRTNSPPSGTSFGGGIRADASTTIASDTITGNIASNGANISDNAASTIQNTIVADPGGGGTNCTGITSLGHNLSSDASCDHQLGLGDIQNTPPQLFGFNFNGGPTLTRRPMPDSPAIDFGTLTGQSTDQRGLQRTWDFMFPYDGAASATDIGAVEIQGPTITATSPASPSDVATPSVIGTAEPGSSVQLYTSTDCTTGAVGPATDGADFASAGIPIGPLAINSSTTVRATAAYGSALSDCSNAITYARIPAPSALTPGPGAGTAPGGTTTKKCRKGRKLKKGKCRKKKRKK